MHHHKRQNVSDPYGTSHLHAHDGLYHGLRLLESDTSVRGHHVEIESRPGPGTRDTAKRRLRNRIESDILYPKDILENEPTKTASLRLFVIVLGWWRAVDCHRPGVGVGHVDLGGRDGADFRILIQLVGQVVVVSVVVHLGWVPLGLEVLVR